MLFFGETRDEQIVPAGKDEVEFLEDGVDEPLPGLCGIFQTERHLPEFEKAE